MIEGISQLDKTLGRTGKVIPQLDKTFGQTGQTIRAYTAAEAL